MDDKTDKTTLEALRESYAASLDRLARRAPDAERLTPLVLARAVLTLAAGGGIERLTELAEDAVRRTRPGEPRRERVEVRRGPPVVGLVVEHGPWLDITVPAHEYGGHRFQEASLRVHAAGVVRRLLSEQEFAEAVRTQRHRWPGEPTPGFLLWTGRSSLDVSPQQAADALELNYDDYAAMESRSVVTTSEGERELEPEEVSQMLGRLRAHPWPAPDPAPEETPAALRDLFRRVGWDDEKAERASVQFLGLAEVFEVTREGLELLAKTLLFIVGECSEESRCAPAI